MEPTRASLPTSSRAAQGLLAVALIILFKYAQPVLLPIAVAIVFTFLFSPLMRHLRRYGVPNAVGAAIVVAGFVIAVVSLVSALATPAASWWEKAPQGIQQLIDRAEGWRRTVPFLTPAQPEQRPTSRAAPPPPADPVKEKIASESVSLTGTLLLNVGRAGISAAVTLILLYFLLASERWLICRTVEAISMRRRRVALIGAVRAAQRDIAAFLATLTVINAGVAVATGAACWLIGLPNPVLWGAIAGVMSFIPYLGPFVTLLTLALAGALTFNSVGEMLLPALAFAAINIVESNFVTPWIVGRRLELSPLTVFLSVILLGWLWGIAGAFIAVPFLVALRSAARRSKSLRVWTQYLDRGRDEPPSLRRLLELRRKPRAHGPAQPPIPVESLIRRRS